MTRRKLGYVDRFTEYLTNEISEDTSGDTISNELELARDTRQFLVLDVSGVEYGKLFSSVISGADLLWKDEAHQITWLLWRAGKMATLCEALANCIINSTDVQEALNLWATIQGWNAQAGDPDTVLPVSVREENLLPAGYVCDQDHRYGMAQSIVTGIHLGVVEILQAIEIATNPAELAAEVADNVPIFELAATGADIALWLQETIQEAYDLAWSDVVRDELACQLFCEMLFEGSCLLSFETVLAVYQDINFDDPPEITDPLEIWVAWLILLPLTSPIETVKIAGLMGLLAIRYGGKFSTFNLGLRTFETMVLLSEDEVNTTWDIVCGACEEPFEHVWLGGDGSVGLTLVERDTIPTCLSAIVGDEIIGCCPGPITSVGFMCDIDPDSVTITRVEMDIEWNKTRAVGDAQTIKVNDVTEVTLVINPIGVGSATVDTGAINVPLATSIQLEGRVRNNTCADGSYYRVVKIRVQGLGIDPWL